MLLLTILFMEIKQTGLIFVRFCRFDIDRKQAGEKFWFLFGKNVKKLSSEQANTGHKMHMGVRNTQVTSEN